MLAIPINRKTIEFKVSVENWRCLMLKIVRVVLQLGMFLLGERLFLESTFKLGNLINTKYFEYKVCIIETLRGNSISIQKYKEAETKY